MEDHDGPAELFEARASLILHLRQLGITDADILRAFEIVPHEVFVPEQFARYAYREGSLPIACGQSITSPTILAGLIAGLEPQGVNKVLEVGTGSGYSAALLSRMARRVFSLEKYRALATVALEHWRVIGYTNIVGLHEDGFNGLAQQAPFDRILLTGSVTDVPEDVIEQLADGGIAVLPLGPATEKQAILRIERADDDFVETEIGTVRLPPLTPGRSRML
ncbi:protein-L-isoaspartate(D-aspartate) O-methyltransferase [Pelagibacterium xiamenense]|uniref:protein-L-isoaspartate(D-aspartate) O-methyltransferase n=1 Tax=Pelagibacterium xiamenense TaxID=2901140 RepID=UPI001E352CCE|nr:protein-L-isoaspartate(D-aspartate) O-methyltransferase [Pelagibacterium xiamenense]MCD7061051.1 protein-L-isoaspartate(D-aspartate) O-methyltransferase [Pelagibacterium xiamenense]